MKKCIAIFSILAMSFSVSTDAFAINQTADATWASAGGKTSADIANAASGDSVEFATNAGRTLTVTNDGVAEDSLGVKNTFNLGAITETTGSGIIDIVSGQAADLTVTVASSNTTGNFTVRNQDANNSTVATTVTNALTTAGGVNITNTETSADDNVSLTVGGNYTVTGATTLTANTGATAANANLTLTGATISSGSFSLDDNTGLATINFNGGAAQAITGAINGASAGEGTLNLNVANNNTTFNSAVGNTGSLLAINLAGTGVARFDSTVAATTTSLNAAGTLDLNGTLTGNLNYTAGATTTLAAGTTITGTTTTNADGQGTMTWEGTSSTGGTIGAVGGNALSAMNIAAGTLTMGHNIAADTVTVDSGGGGTGVLSLNGNRSLHGNLTLAATGGAVSLGTNTLTMSDTGIFTQNAGSTLNTTIASASSFGNIVATGNAVVAAGSTVNVITAGYLANGTTFKIIDGAGGAGVNTPNTITDDSFIYNFTGSTAGGDLSLTVARVNSYDKVSTDSNTQAVGVSLENAGANGPGSDMQTVLNALDGLGSAVAIEQAVEQLDPDVSRGSLDGTNNALNQFLGTVSSHMSANRSSNVNATASTGVATGDVEREVNIWIQGYGNHIEQNRRKGIDGYQANTFGTAFGADKVLNENLTVGAAFGFSWTDINSKGSGNTEVDIVSYQPTLYSSYVNDNWYFDNLVAFAYNDYEQERQIQSPGLSRVAKADFGGQQYSWKGETGYTFDLEGLLVTPIASLQYTHLRQNSYTESGAGALNLSVGSEGYNFLHQGLGLDLASPMKSKHFDFVPSVHAMWFYEYFGDKAETSASFAGGGTSFSTTGVDPAQHSLNLGAELALVTRNNVSFVVNYDAEFKDEFISHTYAGTVRYAF